MSSRTLIRGGCVLTLGARTPNFPEADVLIEDGRVAEVGPGVRARDAELVNATDTIVMPGFVDTHRHTWTSLLRNLGESDHEGPGSTSAYGPHHRPEDVYAATLIGLLGAVEAGITTVVDWSDIQVDEAYTEAALQAHVDAGLRTVFVPSVPDWGGAIGDPLTTVRRLVTDDTAAGPSTSVAFGAPQPARDEPDRIARDWAGARELGLRIHAHAGLETSARGVVSELADRGLLGEDVTLVHCSRLEDRDLDALASSRASVSLAPFSEMASGLGPPPIQELIERGIRPGLGIGDERVAPGDLFAQMRAAISMQHALVFDLKLAGKAGLPALLTTRQVIRFATVDGARVAGLGEATGSLEPGKQADVVVLRANRPNIFPVNDPIGAVVWGMDTSNVDWVFVGGRALLRDGVLQADLVRARDLALAARRRLAEAAGGLLAGAGTAGGGGGT